MNPPGSWAAAWHSGLRAARQNLAAGVVVWIVGGIIVLTYYTWPPARAAWDHLSSWRAHWGLMYSMVSTCLFGGVLPMLFQMLVPSARGRMTAGVWIFIVCFWMYKGVEADLFYRFQAWLFGANAHWTTVAAKVMLDMLVWSPLWAVPNTALPYVWKESGFKHGCWAEILSKQGYRAYVLPAIISNWLVWVPSVCFIYSLPLPLQVPLFNLVLFLFVLILTVLTKQKG